MKTKPIKRTLLPLTFILCFYFSTFVKAQYVLPGSVSGELLFRMDFSHDCEPHFGFLYSDDHGASLSVIKDTYDGIITTDLTPGLVYGGDTSIHEPVFKISLNNGLTWEPTEYPSVGVMKSGCKPGELYSFEWVPGNHCKLFYCSDFGQTQTMMSDSLPNVTLFTPGASTGEVYLLSNNLQLFHSTDFGVSFDSVDVSSQLPVQFAYNDAYRYFFNGPDEGIVYAAITGEEGSRIYLSTDHGHTFQKTAGNGLFNVSVFDWVNVRYLAGRGPGEVYRVYDSIVDHGGCLYSYICVSFSSDWGENFMNYSNIITSVNDSPMVTWGFSLFPNPARDFVNIEFTLKNVKEVEVSLTDLTGRQLRQWPLTQQATTLSCEGLPPGLYFVSLTQGGKTIASAKLIVQ